jgi:hypothetical protein
MTRVPIVGGDYILGKKVVLIIILYLYISVCSCHLSWLQLYIRTV